MIQNLDIVIFRWLNSWAGIGWDWAIIFRAVYLRHVMMVAVTLFVIVPIFISKFRGRLRKNVELFIFTFVSAFAARFIVTELIRFFYNRPRPFEALEGVRQLVDRAGGGSFPSGHAALSFAVATAVSFYYPKTSILFFLAAVSIGMGRIAAGVHWPSDIMGGAVVGIVTALIMKFLVGKIKNSRGARLTRK